MCVVRVVLYERVLCIVRVRVCTRRESDVNVFNQLVSMLLSNYQNHLTRV